MNDQLIIIQPTPFCNINCRYCWLPHRSNPQRMSAAVLEAIFSQVFRSAHFQDHINFVWHAGEPLALPRAYYEEAFALAAAAGRRHGRRYVHSIQTNGMLIDTDYVDLFRGHRVEIGVSLDGPQFIHDRQRVTRSGSGTHAQVMKGIELLQRGGIPFGIICVLTAFALDYADEMFDFFLSHNLTRVAFNIDEVEGVNTTTSYSTADAVGRFRDFIRRFLERTEATRGAIQVREFRQIYNQLLAKNADGNIVNSTNMPMRILNFDYLGNYSTFAPELMGAKTDRFKDFVMGNVLVDPVDSICDNEVFKAVNAEIREGVENCRSTCEYWDVCGGGSPASKFFEHGRFNVTETITCKLSRKVISDVILEHLETGLLGTDPPAHG